MIEPNDVIRMFVPFPDISSDLRNSKGVSETGFPGFRAVHSHMYICRLKGGALREFVKCQTVKPYMLYRKDITNYIDESPDPARNPFQNKTRIDCDKLFVSSGVRYLKKMRTTVRPDICGELAEEIGKIIASAPPKRIRLDAREILALNPLAEKI